MTAMIKNAVNAIKNATIVMTKKDVAIATIRNKMSLASQINQQAITHKNEEQILVVKRQHLFIDGDWQGLKKINLDSYLPIINAHKEFLPRGLMEVDPTYKQIIPYLVFEHQNQYFLIQRQNKT